MNILCLKCNKPVNTKYNKYCSNFCYGQSLIGKKQSKKAVEKRIKKRRGSSLSLETKKKISEANKGKKGHIQTKETRKKISENSAKFWLGRTLPKEMVEKMRRAKLKEFSTTSLSRRIRMVSNYKKWRELIKKRDDYKCVLCGSTQNLIVDHHPIPLCLLIDSVAIKMGENNLFENCLKTEKFWDLNNGRTLCQSCHIKNTYKFYRYRLDEFRVNGHFYTEALRLLKT